MGGRNIGSMGDARYTRGAKAEAVAAVKVVNGGRMETGGLAPESGIRAELFLAGEQCCLEGVR